MSQDTSIEVERITRSIYRNMPAWRKIELVEDANRTARQLTLSGLHSRYPDESPAKLQRRLFGLTLGEEMASRIYGHPDNAE